MGRPIRLLLVAQCLSAFADNAVLFAVVAMVMNMPQPADWYVPAVQSAFYVAYIVLAPWVGEIADTHVKARVLCAANVLKALGGGLLLVDVEPIAAFAVVGIGAAVYSPVKYGILPELADHAQLVRANSWLEGSSILAILLGMVVGAWVADYSILVALLAVVVIFLVSAALALLLPKGPVRQAERGFMPRVFARQIGQFLKLPLSASTLGGSSLFWMAATTLRVILVAWAPLVLAARTATEIAELTFFLAIGIVVGAALVPRLIPLTHYRRVRIPGYLLAAAILMLAATADSWSARAVLVLIGTAGGLFIVPINAQLQKLGDSSMGSGRAVAVQNFFNCSAMLAGVGGYAAAAAQQVGPVTAMLALGGLVGAGALWLAFNLARR